MAKTKVDTSIDENIVDVDSSTYQRSKRDKQAPRYKKARRIVDSKLDGDDSTLHGAFKAANEAPYKELMLPGVHGQFKLWMNQLKRRAEMADRVVQFGNLLGVMPNHIDPMFKSKGVYNGNNGIVLSVLKFFARTHDGWEQLIGTNELAAIFSPDAYLCNENQMEILAENWFDPEGSFKVATVVDGKLCTHRGLTYNQWLEIGAPEDPNDAAEALNEKYKGAVEFEDCYLNSGVPNFAANVLWCDTYWELIPSWLFSGYQAPFGQITGAPGFKTQAGKGFLNDKGGFMQFADKKSVKIQRWGSSIEVADQEIIFAYSAEPEEDTLLKKLKNTSLLEYTTKLSEE